MRAPPDAKNSVVQLYLGGGKTSVVLLWRSFPESCHQHNFLKHSALHRTFVAHPLNTASASISTVSSPDHVGDGMFDLLDHFPPKPRALYLEKFSKEEVVAIVLAVWKERDAARNQAANQGIS
jgi:hypothetical protein